MNKTDRHHQPRRKRTEACGNSEKEDRTRPRLLDLGGEVCRQQIFKSQYDRDEGQTQDCQQTGGNKAQGISPPVVSAARREFKINAHQFVPATRAQHYRWGNASQGSCQQDAGRIGLL